MARAYWCFYFSYLDYVQRLSDAERGELFVALTLYAKDGTVTPLSDKVGVAFDSIRYQLDKDSAMYDSKVQKTKDSARKRWANANACERMRTDANACNENENENEILSKESNKGAKAPRTHHPSVDEVAAYCREQGYSINAQYFVDHYSSNGWKVGRNPMKDWKAAVRTWEQKDRLAKSEHADDRYQAVKYVDGVKYVLPKPKGKNDAPFWQRDPELANWDDIELKFD